MTQHGLASSIKTTLLAHYERAGGLIAANFLHAPMRLVYYPQGLDHDRAYRGPIHPDEHVPTTIPTVEANGASGRERFYAVDANALLYHVHRGAVDFCSWTPAANDPNRVGFARIIIVPRGAATADHVTAGMLAVRDVLARHDVQAIPVLDGGEGAALFIPFADAPDYVSVRAWLHRIADEAVSHDASLLTTDHHDQRSQHVHVNVSSNAVGLGSSLPYAIVGSPTLGMVTPVEWTEVGVLQNGRYTAANSAERLGSDLFRRLTSDLKTQRFGGR
jgi:DNA primase